MITRIDLRHFKCFETLKLPLQPLTLLSGGNASGKSSVMQALVLLHQTMQEHEWSLRLMLNGETICLGTAADVIDQEHGHRGFGIELIYKKEKEKREKSYSWLFSGERGDMAMHVVGVSIDGEEKRIPAPLHNLLPHPHGEFSLASDLKRLTYLSAERLGPQEVYALRDPKDTQVVGPGGEYAVSILFADGQSELTGELVLADAPPTLLRQVEERMARFFPGCGLVVDQVRRANAATLGLRTSTGTDFHRPVHTGFGLTQVFPIVVAALWAETGNLLLIENPEVHLHPAGQAAMGAFLGEVASSGVQVMIETHSDHVLNGIRRAVKTGVLHHEDVALHFFRPRAEASDTKPQVESPAIDGSGNIDSWPDGFFDQFDRDMNYFAGWS